MSEWMYVGVCELVCVRVFACERLFVSGYVDVNRCVRVLSVSVVSGAAAHGLAVLCGR